MFCSLQYPVPKQCPAWNRIAVNDNIMVKSIESHPILSKSSNLPVPQFLAHKISIIIVLIDLIGLCKDK